MAGTSKTIKGYVKTENMILFLFIAIGIGFLGGVVFSAWRSSGDMPVPAESNQRAMAKPPMSMEQRQKLDALLKATQTTPDNVQVWTQLGHFYFDSGEPDKAIDAYVKSLELDSTKPEIWIDLGVMYRRAGDPKKAIQSFEKALFLNQQHEVALFNLGVVQMHDLKDAKAALSSWERLVKINPQAKTPSGQLVKSLLAELKKNNPV
ncbi:MAG: tetratricopeptide repeat protein [Desulfobacteraceae bacterium]|jgi:cytochrome c-type biogenesis protein CcmH/NrfG